MSTLDDLKRAIEAVPKRSDGGRGPDPLGIMHREHMRAEAWRTAFEWREGWRIRCRDIPLQSIQWSSHCDEGDEGMRLIREKLS